MTNIVKFPNAKKTITYKAVDLAKIKEVMPKGSTVKTVLFWAWYLLKLPLFFVMYWLRMPIIFLCEIISVPFLLGWLFSLYAFPDKHQMIWGFAIISFVAFLVAWIYDFVLMMLSPQQMIKTL